MVCIKEIKPSDTIRVCPNPTIFPEYLDLNLVAR